MPRKAFSSDVQVPPLELWVLDHKIVQEVVEIISDGVFTPAQLPETIDKAEAGAHGLINVHDIGVVVPGELVVLQLERILNVFFIELEVEWAILSVQAQHGRASRATIEPDHQRICSGV